MLKVSEIVKYIEQKNSIKLSEIQIDILKHIVKGESIYTPRACGRSLLYGGYADYLKEVVGKGVDFRIDPLDFDKVYTYEAFIENRMDSNLYEEMKRKNISDFNREFNCEYTV